MSTRESGRHEGAVFAPERRASVCLAVEGPAPGQGPLRYPVKVLQDDFGIYRDVKRLYWATTGSGSYEALEVAVLDGNAPGAPHQGPWDLGEDGYSMRLMFFGSRPGTPG